MVREDFLITDMSSDEEMTAQHFWIYVLKGEVNKSGYVMRYVGYTGDIFRRLEEHFFKRNKSTKKFMFFDLIYLEKIFGTVSDAMNRERQTKKIIQNFAKFNKLVDMVDTTELYVARKHLKLLEKLKE